MALLLTTTIAMAQQPRAIFKSIYEGDKDRANELIDKITGSRNYSTPEVTLLARALMYCMFESDNHFKIESGYSLYVENYAKILKNIEEIEKILKEGDISYEQVVRDIENLSFEAAKSINTEEVFRRYYDLARISNHAKLEEIYLCVQRSAYENLRRARTEQACLDFIAEFPNSEFCLEVEALRADIRYDQARYSDDEAELVRFIEEFSTYKYVKTIEDRLMNVRLSAAKQSRDIALLREFVELYPNYSEMRTLKREMAKLEYPTIEDTKEALEAFRQYYPGAEQEGEVKSRIRVFNIIEQCDIREIFSYILSNGYDRNYPRLHRAIAEKFGYIILTEDIREVSLVRFVDESGRIGYLSLDGSVRVSPRYELRVYSDMDLPCQVSGNIFEMLKKRGASTSNNVKPEIAVVSIDGKYGVINSSGQESISPQYHNIALLDNEIVCVCPGSAPEGVDYVCDIYNYNGLILEQNVHIIAENYFNWDAKWFEGYRGAEFKDDYDPWVKELYFGSEYQCSISGGLHFLTPNYRWFKMDEDSRLYYIARNGVLESIPYQSYDIRIIYDDVILAYHGTYDERHAIDLSSGRRVDNTRQFRDMYPISEELIRVQFSSDNKYGFVAKSMNVMINARYDDAYDFSCGTAAVMLNGKGYLIDKRGNIASDEYDKIAPIEGCKGLYAVMRDGKCGIINSCNDIVVEIKYMPKRSTSSYRGDDLHGIVCKAGVVEWDGGEKTPIYTRK
ncbi:MAG: WG repeat-containing protein [Alistipes sp.]|nr:WG repeat-containing protein [Alistipes sp.]